MNILNVEKVSKAFGEKVLLDNVTLGINKGDKIGIIGVNGTGKSTLLKIIAGIEEPDEGNIIKGRKVTVTYLAQSPDYIKDENVLSYVLRGKDSSNEPKAKEILNKLGIDVYDAPMDKLSGGQKKRVALAKVLVEPTEVLILDEPTNHLDNDMVVWLERYIKAFKGELLMVTHDRYFLDNVTNKIVEIDHADLYSYDSNYSGFLELKTEREQMERATEAKRQNTLRRELEWIRRGCQARSTKQQARIDRFEDMKEASRQARAKFDKSLMDMSSVSRRLGRKTIELNNITKAYNGHTYINDFTYIFLRDDRIGIIGSNGCGKSTLMKIITGQIQPDSGSVEIGDTVHIGYFMQENEPLDENQTVLEFVRSIGEYVQTVDGKATASQMCEKFLFPPKQQWTPIRKLSGGEKRRLYLLSVLMSAPNVLILDEPTNEGGYSDYKEKCVSSIYNASENGVSKSNLSLGSNSVVAGVDVTAGGTAAGRVSGGDTDSVQKAVSGSKTLTSKEYNKSRSERLKFTYKEQKEYETIDDDIAALEKDIERIDAEMSKCATDYGKLNDLSKEKAEKEKQLDEKMDRWVYLNDLAERIANQ